MGGKSNTVRERLARLETEYKHQKEQQAKCMKTFENIDKRLEVINSEQGQSATETAKLRAQTEGTRSDIADLKKIIKQRVSAPMTGTDRAILYGSLITALGLVIREMIIAIL